MAKPIPEGMHSITPHLIVSGAAKVIEFYKKVFGAEMVGPVSTMPDGKVMHAHLKIGDSHLMMADDFGKPGIGLAANPRRNSGDPHALRSRRGHHLEEGDRSRGKSAVPAPRTSSGAIDTAWSRTRSGTCGRWPHTSKTSHKRRSRSARSRHSRTQGSKPSAISHHRLRTMKK